MFDEMGQKLFKKVNLIRENIITMPLEIYNFFKYDMNKKENFYKLLIESYKDIESCCFLCLINAWSQLAVIIRVTIEKMGKIIIISENKELMEKYLESYKLYCEEMKKGKVKTKNQIKYEYGWAESICGKNCKRKDILNEIGASEWNDDYEHLLSKFTHGIFSILDFSTENLYNREIDRLMLLIIELFYKLCTSTYLLMDEKYKIKKQFTTDDIFNDIQKFLLENKLMKITI